MNIVSKLTFLAGALAVPFCSTAVFAQSTIAINCGGAADTGADGTSYIADNTGSGSTYTSGGSPSSTATAIAGTLDQAVYQSIRSAASFSYAVPVTNGNYLVTLKFCEIAPYWTTGSRVMNVSLQGSQVLSNFDIFAQSGGVFRAIDKTFPITVTTGSVNIALARISGDDSSDYACISGIVIAPVPHFPPAITTSGDQTIMLPTSSATLNATATDGGATISSYAWTQLSGPTTAVIGSASSASTSVSSLSEGVYVFQIQVTDSLSASSSATVKVTVNPISTTPVVVAAIDCGSSTAYTASDGTVYAADPAKGGGSAMSTTTSISGTSDQALYQTIASAPTLNYSIPVANGSYTVKLKFCEIAPYWTTGSRVMNVSIQGAQVLSNFDIFATAGAVFTALDESFTATVANGALAIQLARVSTDDGSDYACISGIEVIQTTSHLPPTVSAGSNQSITLPTTTATLTGSAAAHGGTISSYAWTQVSGPATATFGTPSAASTTVTASTAGGYVFQLEATDSSGSTGTATVQLMVNGSGTNLTPFVSAGSDRTFPVPASGNILLTGWGTDLDGTISTYAWTQTSGPSATIVSSSAPTTAISGLSSTGTYVFKLTVTDNSGAQSNASVTVTLTSASSSTVHNISATATGEIYIPDAASLGINPGDTIVIAPGAYPGGITLGDIHGSSGSPVLIVNGSGGQVSAGFFRIHQSTFFHVSGSGTASVQYGFLINSVGLSFNDTLSDYEIERCEVGPSDGVGIFLDEQPTADNPSTLFGYTCSNVFLHDNYVHDTQGEGFYVGQSASNGDDTTGGLVPCRWNNVNIYDNRIENTGWTALQMSDGRFTSSEHNNVVRNFGQRDTSSHRAGIIMGANTNGFISNNAVINGTGNGIECFGFGSISITGNVVDHAGIVDSEDGPQDVMYVDQTPILEETNAGLAVNISGNTFNQTVRYIVWNNNANSNEAAGTIESNTIYNASGGTTATLFNDSAGDTISGNTIITR